MSNIMRVFPLSEGPDTHMQILLSVDIILFIVFVVVELDMSGTRLTGRNTLPLFHT
jgi:hypothetical protein